MAEQQPEKRFTLTFSMENAAFQGGATAAEIIRILDHVRGHVATGRFSAPVVDVNGNTIGQFVSTWREDPPDPAESKPKRKKR